MSRLLRAALIVVLLIGLLPTAPVVAAMTLPGASCEEYPQSSGEIYLICVPKYWTGSFDVVVFAHGYVPPGPDMRQYYEQLLVQHDDVLGDLYWPDLVNSQGYAFISTSYRKNGLAVKEGLADTLNLIKWFKSQPAWAGRVGRVYLIGASEGGLITTLAAEKQSPIAGGLALCGPIGNFRSQINYWGDFRVLFDYFYKNVLPPRPVEIPLELMQNWEPVYVPQIAGLIGNPANQHTTEQLLKTSRAPIDPAKPSTAIDTTIGILSYNVFATNEAKVELGGQPFDNKLKWYVGSDNDWALNGPHGVQRFRSDLSALLEISKYYQTSGKLKVPLVTMHTLGDPIVPYWHETLYNAKALFGGSVLKHLNIPINRYGHCTFTADEALAGFAVLTYMVTGKLPASAQGVLPAAGLPESYAKLVREYQAMLPAQPQPAP